MNLDYFIACTAYRILRQGDGRCERRPENFRLIEKLPNGGCYDGYRGSMNADIRGSTSRDQAGKLNSATTLRDRKTEDTRP